MAKLRRIGFALSFLFALILVVAWQSCSVGPPSTPDDPQSALFEEVDALGDAFRQYRTNYGVFPPNGSDGAEAIARHLKLRFPRNEDTLPAPFDAAEAVVFWLGGFSQDSSHPLTGPGGPLSGGARNPGLFEFDKHRLILRPSGYLVYLPPGRAGGKTLEPIVYFNTSNGTKPSYLSLLGEIAPYRTVDGKYVYAESFQVLSAGLDNDWGNQPPPTYPEGPFTGGHADNVTNFDPRLLGQIEPAKE